MLQATTQPRPAAAVPLLAALPDGRGNGEAEQRLPVSQALLLATFLGAILWAGIAAALAELFG